MALTTFCNLDWPKGSCYKNATYLRTFTVRFFQNGMDSTVIYFFLLVFKAAEGSRTCYS